jgi:hypothetical protein
MSESLFLHLFRKILSENQYSPVKVMLPLGLVIAGIGGATDFVRACTDDQCLQQRQWHEENIQRAIELQQQQQQQEEWQRQQQYQPPPPSPKDPWIPLINYPVNLALVWWHDSNRTPGFSLAIRRYSPLQAMNDAMNHCFLRGGQGCRVAFVSSASWIAVARGEDGGLYAAQGGKKDEVRQAALDRCQSGGRGCAIVTIIQNNQ